MLFYAMASGELSQGLVWPCLTKNPAWTDFKCTRLFCKNNQKTQTCNDFSGETGPFWIVDLGYHRNIRLDVPLET